MFTKRLGESGNGLQCPEGHYCPQILEMNSGDFAVVGEDITTEAERAMLPGAGIGPSERVVRIPRRVLVAARKEIPISA